MQNSFGLKIFSFQFVSQTNVFSIDRRHIDNNNFLVCLI